jgi:hypothetical protein
MEGSITAEMDVLMTHAPTTHKTHYGKTGKWNGKPHKWQASDYTQCGHPSCCAIKNKLHEIQGKIDAASHQEGEEAYIYIAEKDVLMKHAPTTHKIHYGKSGKWNGKLHKWQASDFTKCDHPSCCAIKNKLHEIQEKIDPGSHQEGDEAGGEAKEEPNEQKSEEAEDYNQEAQEEPNEQESEESEDDNQEAEEEPIEQESEEAEDDNQEDLENV